MDSSEFLTLVPFQSYTFFSLGIDLHLFPCPLETPRLAEGSLAEDDALNILSPICSKSVCLKQGVPINDLVLDICRNRSNQSLVQRVVYKLQNHNHIDILLQPFPIFELLPMEPMLLVQSTIRVFVKVQEKTSKRRQVALLTQKTLVSTQKDRHPSS
ncbi:hypothetical protein M9H77_02719 [Catharanthus roseus]|uniref:Uncharacterized protein n=1 Tax=Catharanthus roseus TaxID=4058 RepID=A0ACC0C9P6_CATRO|nr:hypothetical protein M9H77_02719 [Catharanthus roseus]